MYGCMLGRVAQSYPILSDLIPSHLILSYLILFCLPLFTYLHCIIYPCLYVSSGFVNRGRIQGFLQHQIRQAWTNECGDDVCIDGHIHTQGKDAKGQIRNPRTTEKTLSIIFSIRSLSLSTFLYLYLYLYLYLCLYLSNLM